MNYTALTSKYRPQLFSEVAGQSLLKKILSKAAAENKIVPAYLFSGTRGVGKTTLARIFAKAINCRHAPAPEPCNDCDLCRAVTLGTSMDVVEIDGASNRGIDDVRRLKEVVGYAPMEGRYKIFIIDEAHMLSREAFNALLKTLEEPPAGVSFIMATTEPHKFPATIISRCQHYIFKGLPEDELTAHLASVLGKEGIEYEDAALRLLARRGAGSVRDSMSLLGQVLALGEKTLSQQTVRSVLGLAGQEAFEEILSAIRENNCLKLLATVREFLNSGLDIGFFLRELSTLWRNLFILRQSGRDGLKAVELPEQEAERILALSQKFELGHIHACWQMTLEGQRRVQSSLDPGLALELLLLNLALLPQLMPLDSLSAIARRTPLKSALKAGGSSGEAEAAQENEASPDAAESLAKTSDSVSGGHLTEDSNEQEKTRPEKLDQSSADMQADSNLQADSNMQADEKIIVYKEAENTPPSGKKTDSISSDRPDKSSGHSLTKENANEQQDKLSLVTPSDEVKLAPFKNGDPESDSEPSAKSGAEQNDKSGAEQSTKSGTEQSTKSGTEPSAKSGTEPDSVSSNASPSDQTDPVLRDKKIQSEKISDNTNFDEANKNLLPGSSPGSSPSQAEEEKKDEEDDDEEENKDQDSRSLALEKTSWQAIKAQANMDGAPAWFSGLANTVEAEWKGDILVLKPKNSIALENIMQGEGREILNAALRKLLGTVPDIHSVAPTYKAMGRDELKEKVNSLPSAEALKKTLGARLLDYGQLNK